MFIELNNFQLSVVLFSDNWVQLPILWFVGFEILAFPCNQFGGQEPGTNEEIVQFACTRFKAEYPIFDKVKSSTMFFLN